MANITTEQMLGNMRDKISQTFARQDGFYETMGVGTAVNLAGQTERTDDAMYRKSGGSEEVATGLATIANIKGKTVAWNQLVDTSTTSVTTISGHVYYTNIGGVESLVTGDGIDIAVTGGTDMVIDLTLVYNKTNVATTVAIFKADYFKWFGKPLTYDEYDAGSLRSVQLESLKTTGFNQYNNGGAKVIGGLQYQITGTYTSITLNDEAITPDANGLFTPSTTGTLTIVGGGSDTCVHISGDRNGEYEPYEEHVAPLPVTTLKGKLNGEGESVTIFPDGMRSAGTIADEIYTVGDKTYAVKRVSSVDLGTLTWRYDTNWGTRFYVNNFNARNFNENGICSQYLDSRGTFFSSPYSDKSFILYKYWNQLSIRDTSFTDDATFKTAMSGVMLYFQLDTPLVYEVDDFALPKRYLVDGGGTEEQVQKANVQGIAAILTCIYGVDAVGILNKLPKNYISEKSMDNLLAQLNTATGGVWSKTWNENSGEWDFSYTPNAQTNNTTNQEEA